jgi:hypothetical protein
MLLACFYVLQVKMHSYGGGCKPWKPDGAALKQQQHSKQLYRVMAAAAALAPVLLAQGVWGPAVSRKAWR